MTAAANVAEARARARTPGSAILTAWRAEREAMRGGGAMSVRNDVTDSAIVIGSDNAAVTQLFGIGSSAAGVSVTPESAMRVSAVFACVQRIAGAIASLPLRQYERVGDGERRPVPDMPLHFLLNEQPCDRFTAASHWEGVSGAQLLRGAAYTYIARNRMGAIRELIPLPYGAVVPRRIKTVDSDRVQYAIQDIDVWGADQDDMLHFPGFGFDGLWGRSVIQWAARNAAGNAMAMDEYSGRFFAGGAHPSIVLTTEKGMKEPAMQALREAFATKYSGVENAHKLPLILTDGLKADVLSVSAEDSQLLDARKFQVIDIARAFGVPPHLIGETSASTSWGSGIESMMRAFVSFTLQGHLVRIEQELNRKLFRTSRYFVEFDRDALLQADSEAQSKYYRAAIGGPGQGPGYMAIDEIRKSKNLPPLGGKCAAVYWPPDKAAAGAGTDTTTPPPDPDAADDPATNQTRGIQP